MNQAGIAKSIHQRLLNVRDETGEDFNSILARYGLERLLYRLVISNHSDSFVLKGAMLFQLWHDVPGRPTRDIDLLGFGDPSHERLKQVFSDACSVSFDADGLRFDLASILTSDIRDDQEYFGIRIRLHGFLNTARVPVQVDVGFGDSVTPPAEMITYPTLLDLPSPRLRAYHPATVVAEKVNAMVVYGLMNSRMKDFYDVYVLLEHMDWDEEVLVKLISATFDKRKVDLPKEMPVAFTTEFLEDGLKEKQWNAFLNRSKLMEFQLPLREVIDYLSKRLWPIIQKAQIHPERRSKK